MTDTLFQDVCKAISIVEGCTIDDARSKAFFMGEDKGNEFLSRFDASAYVNDNNEAILTDDLHDPNVTMLAEFHDDESATLHRDGFKLRGPAGFPVDKLTILMEGMLYQQKAAEE